MKPAKSTWMRSLGGLPALALALGLTVPGAMAHAKRKDRRSSSSDTTQSLVMEASVQKSPIEWGGGVGYAISSDFAAEREPRVYTHKLKGGVGASFKDTATGEEIVNGSLGLEGQYTSLDRDIEEGREVIELSDISLGLGKSIGLPKAGRVENSLEFGVGATIPISTESQYQAIKTIPSAGVTLGSQFSKRYAMKNTIEGDYLIQEYTHSPISGEVNMEGGLNYGLSFSARITKKFTALLGGGARISRFTDGTQVTSFNNSQAVAFKHKQISASVRHVNGNHAGHNDDVEIWYVDEYRRILSFNLGYEF